MSDVRTVIAELENEFKTGKDELAVFEAITKLKAERKIGFRNSFRLVGMLSEKLIDNVLNANSEYPSNELKEALKTAIIDFNHVWKPDKLDFEFREATNQETYLKFLDNALLSSIKTADSASLHYNLKIIAGYFQETIIELGNPYPGQCLKVSDAIAYRLPSILILPGNPKDAIASFPVEGQHTLFQEYDPENSAETIVQKYYGLDGEYGRFYARFFDCRDRYPGQKHLFHP